MQWRFWGRLLRSPEDGVVQLHVAAGRDLFVAGWSLHQRLLRLLHGQDVHHELPASDCLQSNQQHLRLASQNQLQAATRQRHWLCQNLSLLMIKFCQILRLCIANCINVWVTKDGVKIQSMTVGTTFPAKPPLIYFEEGLVSPHFVPILDYVMVASYHSVNYFLPPIIASYLW